MKELHAIRAELHRQLRDRPLDERLKKLCKMSKVAIEKPGIKIKSTEVVKSGTR